MATCAYDAIDVSKLSVVQGEALGWVSLAETICAREGRLDATFLGFVDKIEKEAKTILAEWIDGRQPDAEWMMWGAAVRFMMSNNLGRQILDSGGDLGRDGYNSQAFCRHCAAVWATHDASPYKPQPLTPTAARRQLARTIRAMKTYAAAAVDAARQA